MEGNSSFPAVDTKKMILPKRIKTERLLSVPQSSPSLYRWHRELGKFKSKCTRVRFGRTEEGKLRLGWTKYKMIGWCF